MPTSTSVRYLGAARYFDFETMSTLTDSYSKGFVDILVTLGKKNAAFLIEAKELLPLIFFL